MKLGDQGRPRRRTRGNHGGEGSNTRGRREDRPTPARTSAVSLFGFLRAEFIERPRIFWRDGLGLADVDDIAAVGLDLDAGGIDARLARILAHADERRLAWSRPLVLHPQC